MVDVVQSVEHRIVVPSVVGSSPIIHPSVEHRIVVPSVVGSSPIIHPKLH